MKRIISSIFAALMIFAMLSVPAFASEGVRVANVHDAMNRCREYSIFSIDEGVLYNNGEKECDVYLITLTGSTMSWDKNDIKSMYTCIKSGFVKTNPYLELLLEEAKKTIPEGSKIVLIGHSLGGMVAQQFAADPEIKEKYEILNILTMGSPYIPVKNREGDLHRMADSGDAVPFLSCALLANFWMGNFTYECNGYFGDPNGAHNYSYNTAEKWLKYDCFGISGGTHVVEF